MICCMRQRKTYRHFEKLLDHGSVSLNGEAGRDGVGIGRNGETSTALRREARSMDKQPMEQWWGSI